MVFGTQFIVGTYAQKLSETVLREARADHDLLVGAPKDAKDGGNKRNASSSWGGNDSKKVICCCCWHSHVHAISCLGSCSARDEGVAMLCVQLLWTCGCKVP